MELQCLLIVVCYVCHLIVSLVTNNVVNEVQFAWWPTKNKQTRDSNLTSLRLISKANFSSQCWQEDVLHERFLEARQEDTFVVGPLNQSVGSVSILQQIMIVLKSCNTNCCVNSRFSLWRKPQFRVHLFPPMAPSLPGHHAPMLSMDRIAMEATTLFVNYSKSYLVECSAVFHRKGNILHTISM